MELNLAIEALKALAQDSRLGIFRQLVQAGPDGLSVGVLRERMRMPGATLSNHLNVLRQAGLISDQRVGRSILCCADYACMNDLIAFLTENCCGAMPKANSVACSTAGACQPNVSPPKKSRVSK